MLNISKMLVLCQLALLSVFCNEQHDSGISRQCDSTCILPEFPKNGRLNVVGDTVDTLPGAVVPNLTVIQYQCDVGYVPYPHSTAVCSGGTWDTQFTKCQRKVTCPSPVNPAHGSYELSDLRSPFGQGADVPNWTTVIYSCEATFEIVGNRTSVCFSGLWTTEPPQCQTLPSDCGDVFGSTSGVYVIQPTRDSEPFDVYCDLTLAGQKWTVIHHRLSADVNFYRNYTEYSAGFGIKSGNHWLGLEHIHQITKEGHHELYVELEAHNGTKAYARYDTFFVNSSSTGFQLTISGYSGTAGDSMYDTPLSGDNLNGMKFTTFDKDQDMWPSGNCAEDDQGAWWYNACSFCNLNGPYYDRAEWGWQTMNWRFNFGQYALKTARMLIRRK